MVFVIEYLSSILCRVYAEVPQSISRKVVITRISFFHPLVHTEKEIWLLQVHLAHGAVIGKTLENAAEAKFNEGRKC